MAGTVAPTAILVSLGADATLEILDQLLDDVALLEGEIDLRLGRHRGRGRRGGGLGMDGRGQAQQSDRGRRHQHQRNGG